MSIAQVGTRTLGRTPQGPLDRVCWDHTTSDSTDTIKRSLWRLIARGTIFMSSEKISPPPDKQQAPNTPVTEQRTLPVERPALKFSAIHWATTGVVRLLYRGWTRVAAHLFPEDSSGERIAIALH